jgi:hypothetical protein
VASWNIGGGLQTKLTEIEDLIMTENIDILTIIEAEAFVHEDIVLIQGFKTFLPLVKTPKDKVRIVTLVAEKLVPNTKLRSDLMNPGLPSLWLELHGLLLCSIYREWSPGGVKTAESQMEQIKLLNYQLLSATSSKKGVVVLGDLNLDQEKWDEKSYSSFNLAEELRTCLSMCGLEVHGLGHTYFSNHVCGKAGVMPSSAIDHIYSCTGRSVNVKTGTLLRGMSDHLPILAEVKVGAKLRSKKVTFISRRSFRKFDREAFERDLILHGGHQAIGIAQDVDQQVELLEDMIHSVLDIHAPFRLIKQRDCFRTGLSQETKSLMKSRDLLQKQMRSLKGDQKVAKHKQYKKVRNQCLNLQRKDSQKLCLDKFNSFSHPNDAWKAAKAITKPKSSQTLQVRVDDNVVHDESEVANALNKFFLDKVKGLREGIIDSKINHPVVAALDIEKLELRTVSEGEVRNAINKLKDKPSCGLDQVNTMIIKAGGELLVVALWHIINTSILSGQVPKKWKEAKIIPLFKKGDAKECANYRPVSNLSVMSKVLEMVVNSQISKYCDKHDIIPKSQHGFQKSKSTMTALISMVDSWEEALERGESVGVLLFDLSAAFDTLDPPLLLEKLKRLNFSSNTVNWIQSFMSTRSQKVQVGGSLSDSRPIDLGVAQGSILGPLLFLLYVSDFESCISESEVVGYADDTSISCSSKDVQQLLKSLESEAAKVLAYFAANKLVANAKKTKFLLIRGKGAKKWPESTVSIGGELVTESMSERILGVVVSNNLKWSDQYRSVVNSLRYRIFTLKRLAYHLPRSALKGLLDGIVYSAVRFSLPLFGKVRLCHSDLHIGGPDSVQKMLNCALRVVLNVKKVDKVSIKTLHEETASLTLNQLAIESTRRLVQSILKNECKGLKDFFKPEMVAQEKELRSASHGQLTVFLRQETNNSFRVQSKKIWNSLDDKAKWARKLPKLQLLDFP